MRTLIYIQNTYEYIHISAYRHFHVYNICMLIKILISFYTFHLAFYENFFNCLYIIQTTMYKMTQISITINNILYLTPIERYEYLSSCCHNNKDYLKHHTCVYICFKLIYVNICILRNSYYHTINLYYIFIG